MTYKELMEKEREIYDVMYKNGLHGEVTAEDFGDELHVDIHIEWGDWKHDHLFLKNVIEKEFGPDEMYSITTDENGSDTYSATHTFIWYPKQETENLCFELHKED